MLALLDMTSFEPLVFDAQALTFSVPFLLGHLPAIREYIDRVAGRASTEEEQKRAAWLQTILAWDAGRPSEASARLGEGRGPDVARVLGALYWGGDSVEGRKAATRLAATTSTPMSEREILGTIEMATSPTCAVALWAVAHGETGGVPSVSP